MSRQLRFWGGAPPLHNVFFAARPDAATGAHIASLARELSGSLRLTGKRLPLERLHVSLVGVGGFHGACPASVINDAMAIADAIALPPFTATFDRVECFNGRGGKKALVLTGDEGAAGLMSFRQALHLAMAKRGLGNRQSSGFTPHLTMMYVDQTFEGVPVDPVSWTIDNFVLLDSLVGQSKHVLLGRWLRA